MSLEKTLVELEEMTSGTVRDFKNYLKKSAGVDSCGPFIARSKAHKKLWDNLDAIVKKAKIRPQIRDPDAEVKLGTAQWRALGGRLMELLLAED